MALCSRPAEVVDKTAFRMQVQISPVPSPLAVHLSLKGLDGAKYRQHPKYHHDPLRSIWKCCGSDWELICPWIVDINLDRAGVLKYLNLFVKSRSRAQPEMVADWPLEKERENTCCVIYLCCCLHGAGKVCLDAHTELLVQAVECY